MSVALRNGTRPWSPWKVATPSIVRGVRLQPLTTKPSVRSACDLSRMRTVAPSPRSVGTVTTRRSILRSSTLTATRPSWGTRFSAMSSSLMILMRETTPATIRLGTRATSLSTPSTRKRTRMSFSSGSKWTSEAPSLTACPRIE